MTKIYDVPSFRDLLRLAKKLRRERGIQNLQEAQEAAAREAGFEDLFAARRSLPAERWEAKEEPAPKVLSLIEGELAAIGEKLRASGIPEEDVRALVERQRLWLAGSVDASRETRENYHMCQELTGFMDLHHWFGLSYSSYQILDEAILALVGKPVRVELEILLRELDGSYYWRPGHARRYRVRCKDRRSRYVKDPLPWDRSGERYLVVPRLVMSAMPMPWQTRMIMCLEALRQAVENVEVGDYYQVLLLEAGRRVQDPLANYRHGQVILRGYKVAKEG